MAKFGRQLRLVMAVALALWCCAKAKSASDAGTTLSDAGAPDAGVTQTDAGTDGGPAVALDGGLVEPAPCDLAAVVTGPRTAYDAAVACVLSKAPADEKARGLEQFVAYVDAHGGFPIIDGEKLLFVHLRSERYDPGVGSHSGALTVAGDFNGWSPQPMVDHGEGLSSLDVTLAGWREKGIRYKFISDTTTWFADPLATRFDFDEYGEFSLLAGRPGLAHVERLRAVASPQLGNERPVYVLVPPDYETTTGDYAVLYMQDGQNLVDPRLLRSAEKTWEMDQVLASERAAGTLRPLLVVGIANTPSRTDEYTFTPDKVGDAAEGGKGDAYRAFVVQQVKPLIDARYRTRKSPAETGILGSSLGGLVSYEIGLKHPELFGCVGGMSSTFKWGRLGLQNETVLERYVTSTSLATAGQRFYLDAGGEASDCPGGWDGACEALEMKSILEAKGYTRYPLDPSAAQIDQATNILHWQEPGAQHNEAVWSGRVFRFLRFCFGAPPAP